MWLSKKEKKGVTREEAEETITGLGSWWEVYRKRAGNECDSVGYMGLEFLQKRAHLEI